MKLRIKQKFVMKQNVGSRIQFCPKNKSSTYTRFCVTVITVISSLKEHTTIKSQDVLQALQSAQCGCRTTCSYAIIYIYIYIYIYINDFLIYFDVVIFKVVSFKPQFPTVEHNCMART